MNFTLFVIQVFFTAIAVSLFLFNFWKKLKDDYTQNQIFTTGFYILLGLGVGNIISNSFLPVWWFWMSLAGGLVGLMIGFFRFSLRIIETLDAAIGAGLNLFAIALLANWYFGKSTYALIGFAFTLLFIFFYKLLDKHYKKFTWYKSGRVGFSGLATSGTFFLLRGLIALRLPDVLSFAGRIDIVISAVLAFVSFFALLNLSRKVT